MTTTTERVSSTDRADGEGKLDGKLDGKLTAAQERALFFKRFLSKGVQVASFMPSSKGLARAAARGVSSDTPQTILELGAGTGAITTEILRRKHPESRVISVEMDPAFVTVLRSACPGAQVVEADVRSLPEVLDQLGVSHIDVLINGLPTPSLPESVNRTVLEVVETRGSEELVSSQITVMPLVYLKMYRGAWERVSFELVMANVPPAGVYHMSRLRSDWRDAIPGKRALPPRRAAV